MVGSIVVPLDGSPAGESVLPAAALLAERTGSRLLLVRPVPPRGRPGTVRYGAGEFEFDRGRRIGCARSYLQSCAERVRARYPRLHVGAAAPVGPWPDAVLDEVALECASLIVASTRLGGGAWSAEVATPLALGRAALELSRRAAVPVLLLPRGGTLQPDRARAGAARGLRALVPLDGGPGAEVILPVLVRLAAHLPVRVTVLRVVAPTAFAPTAASYCRNVVAWLERYGVPARFEIRVGDPVEEIGRAALEHTDLLALGLPEALPWRFGYTAERLLRGSTVPVLQLRGRRTEHVVPSTPSRPTAAPAPVPPPPPSRSPQPAPDEARQASPTESPVIERRPPNA